MPRLLPKALQILSDSGIVRIAAPVNSNSIPASPIVTSDFGSANSAGSSDANAPPISGSNIASSKQQPPLLWKAIGFCLKDKFTISGSLSDDNRAFFFGDPGQVGISEGSAYPQEVTNYQLFRHANTIQRVNRPNFTLEGNSYFEFLNLYAEHAPMLARASADDTRYLKYVGEQNDSADLIEARRILVEAKSKKDRIWQAGGAAYTCGSLKNHVKTKPSLIDYMDKDKKYQSAWNAEETAEQALTNLRKPALSSVSVQLDMIRLADMRLEPQVGNNMPVIAIDSNYIPQLLRNPTLVAEDLVSSKNVFYQPLHGLPQYETVADYWIKASAVSSDPKRDGPYMIPLADIWKRPWSDLGHPLLDQARTQESLTEEQKQFMNSLTATLTFLQTPYSGSISRGLWDVTDLRNRFHLQPDAPQSIKGTVCKTSKLILAWGIEIELTIPDVVPSSSIKNITLAAMDLPLKISPGNSNKLTFTAGGDGLPILVGAFADVI